MKISKKDLSLIPNMEFIKFVPLQEQTEVKCWNGGLSSVVAKLVIDNQIDKEVIIDDKTLKNMRKLIGDEEELDIKVSNNFVVSSNNGVYKGSIVTEDMDPKYEFNEEDLKVFNFNSSVVERAMDYANPSHKNPILMGINIGESGVQATDGFKFYCYGDSNNTENCINVPLEVLKYCIKNEFENVKTNGKQVIIDDRKGIRWFGKLIEGRFPNTSKIISNKGESLNLNIGLITSTIDFAITSLDEVKQSLESKSIFSGLISFSCKNKKLTISTDKYTRTLETDSKDFSFNMFAGHAAMMLKMLVSGIYYTDSKKPLFIESRENEWCIFNLIEKEQ